MAGTSKIIKTRIKSVGNIRKITKAMELVAATKMRKAVNSSQASRVYAQHARELLGNLGKDRNLRHPLLKKSKGNKELLVVVASNRGLCGGYNVNIVKTANEYIKNNKDKKIDLVLVGRKAETMSRATGIKAVASFVNFSDDLRSEEIIPLARLIIEEFTEGKYSKVALAFTDFISGIKYEPKISSLLPISKDVLGELPQAKEQEVRQKPKQVILFEPGEERVLGLVLPRLTEVLIYQALLEASASEHSARMLAMKNANDNARDILEELMLYYNQARQAGITQEIAEISGGAQALSDN